MYICVDRFAAEILKDLRELSYPLLYLCRERSARREISSRNQATGWDGACHWKLLMRWGFQLPPLAGSFISSSVRGVCCPFDELAWEDASEVLLEVVELEDELKEFSVIEELGDQLMELEQCIGVLQQYIVVAL